MDIQFFKKLSLPKGIGFFAKSKQSVIGLDIGTSSIKIVQLKKEKGRAILETYGALAVGPYNKLSIGQAAYLPEEKSAEAIRDLFKEAGVKAKDAAISIGLRNTFITTVEIPAKVKGNINEVISIEARRYIPLPISEVVIDSWVIPPSLESDEDAENNVSSKRDMMNVLLVAIYRDAIENYKNIASKSGLNIQLFEIEIFSSIRSCIGREASSVLLLDIGASITKMAVVDYGVVRLVHTFEKGSQDLTLSLSSSLGIDFQRAEELKQQIGLSSRPEHKEIASVLEPMVQYIFSEANRFIADYRRKYNRSVGKVILTGGGSLLKGIVDAGVKIFGTEVVLSNPFLKVDYPPFMSAPLKESGPNFSVALGLALRGLQNF